MVIMVVVLFARRESCLLTRRPWHRVAVSVVDDVASEAS